jgi:hypothetical protein
MKSSKKGHHYHILHFIFTSVQFEIKDIKKSKNPFVK